MATRDTSVLNDPTFKNVTVARLYITSLYTAVIWDYLVTLRMEYVRIWKSPWTITKAVFLFLRYWTLVAFAVPEALYVGNWSAEFCGKYSHIEPAICMWIICSADCILLIRCYALWEKNKYILAFGIFGLLAIASVQAAGAALVSPVPFPEGVARFSCIAAGKPGGTAIEAAFWLTPFCFDVSITSLTLYRAYVYRQRGTKSPVLDTFVRSGVGYFICIASVNLINTIFYYQKNPNIQAVNSSLALLVTSLLAQRLVLHTRREEQSSHDSRKWRSGGNDSENSNTLYSYNNPHPSVKSGNKKRRPSALANLSPGFPPSAKSTPTRPVFALSGMRPSAEYEANQPHSAMSAHPMMGPGVSPMYGRYPDGHDAGVTINIEREAVIDEAPEDDKGGYVSRGSTGDGIRPFNPV